MISNVRPPAKRESPRMSEPVRAGSALLSTCAGMEFSARTGMRQREIQVACAMKAPKNLRGEERMVSKRESWPSPRTRLKRKLPTINYVSFRSSTEEVRWKMMIYTRRVAHTATAALINTCLQLYPLPSNPFTAPMIVGLFGVDFARKPAYLALALGR